MLRAVSFKFVALSAVTYTPGAWLHVWHSTQFGGFSGVLQAKFRHFLQTWRPGAICDLESVIIWAFFAIISTIVSLRSEQVRWRWGCGVCNKQQFS